MENLKGYEKLKKAVERDCNDRNSCGCFNPSGCDKPNAKVGDKSCFHKYCDKFKWIMDRAEHYSEKTGLTKDEILNAWEEDRSYWYMNYYQEAHQPEIKGNNVQVFETTQELLQSIGEKKFRCPACEGVSTSPYICNSGIEHQGKVCNWNVSGLFGDLGKGANIYIKEKISGETIFMPIAWENKQTY